ncbi:MAG: hypothetical protein ACOCTH_00375 [Halodesulfurarchaeum sp.]
MSLLASLFRFVLVAFGVLVVAGVIIPGVSIDRTTYVGIGLIAITLGGMVFVEQGVLN